VIEDRVDLASAKKDRVEMVASLRAARLPVPDGMAGNVLAALAEAGVFRLRAVVVGSIAFQCYAPMLGFRAAGGIGRTGDVDIGQFPEISVAVEDAIDTDFLSVLKTVDSRFEAVPSPFRKNMTMKYVIRSGSEERFSVDILAPSRGPDIDGPVELSALRGHARVLRFFDFLIHKEIEAVVLHGPGIPVRVPRPEKFAVHKLIVSRDRLKRPGGHIKSRKDMAQASLLLQVLAEDRPGELEIAWNELLERGPSWRKLAKEAWRTIPSEIRDILREPSLDGKGNP